jgi:hypothetical protein
MVVGYVVQEDWCISWPPSQEDLLILSHAVMKHADWPSATIKQMTRKIVSAAISSRMGRATQRGSTPKLSEGATEFVKGEVSRLSLVRPAT